MESIDKALLFVSEKMKVVGAVFLFGMALLTCVDVVGRLFKYPIFGSIELVSFMGVIAIAMSLPFCHQAEGHIGVELFVRKFPRRVRDIVKICTELVSFALFAIVSWRMFEYALKAKASGELSMNLQLPEYGIIFLLACCFVIFTLVIVNNILKTISKMRKK